MQIATRSLLALTILSLLAAAAPARAQLSFPSAIDMAVRHSPRVQAAQADVNKALAALQEARDVYIPSVSAGSGLGPPSYGFPLGQPSIFNLSAQSLVLNFSQRDYIRAARSALEAANFALLEARQGIAEEAAMTYIALDRDVQRESALAEEDLDAGRLVSIVQDRLDAGQDTAINLTGARLLRAQLRLAVLRDRDETEYDGEHLARLLGLPERGLATLTTSVSTGPMWESLPDSFNETFSPGVAATYASARSKQQIAFGDSRFERRPQVSFGAQYSRFATFNNYGAYYLRFQQNNAEIGFQFTLPLFDAAHRARARQSAAEAVRSLHEADQQRDQFFDSRLKVKHADAELAARAEVATLDHQLAQQQLDAMLVQLQTGNGNPAGKQMTPEDEQNARIAEREKFLALLNTTLQLRQNKISLLRQTGQLETWLKSLSIAP